MAVTVGRSNLCIQIRSLFVGVIIARLPCCLNKRHIQIKRNQKGLESYTALVLHWITNCNLTLYGSSLSRNTLHLQLSNIWDSLKSEISNSITPSFKDKNIWNTLKEDFCLYKLQSSFFSIGRRNTKLTSQWWSWSAPDFEEIPRILHYDSKDFLSLINNKYYKWFLSKPI